MSATRGAPRRRCSTSTCSRSRRSASERVVGGVCRMGLDATPFMLPLLFQVGFGFSPMQAGSLTFSSTLGAMLVRSGSKSLLRAGFRRALVVWRARRRGGDRRPSRCSPPTPRTGSSSPASCLGVRAQHPVPGVEYDQLRRRAFAVRRRSTSVSGVFQQLARGFGVALGAALLAIVAAGEHVSVGDFRLVFLLIAADPAALGPGLHAARRRVTGPR